MKHILAAVMMIIISQSPLFAQGPPITGDKAIMLGEGTMIVKTLTKINVTEENGSHTYAPLMIHYLPTSNTIFALHLPYFSGDGISGMADISVRGKYQFYRNDMKARTHRMAIKSVHWFPTGVNTQWSEFGIDKYQTMLTVISGYETLKHGIGTEIGYRHIQGQAKDFGVFNLGFGLPLLKQVYPVNQLNLYFEYDTEWFGDGNKNIFYSQGIQYARRRLTMEMAVQLPLVQQNFLPFKKKYSIYLGTRYVW